MPNASIVIRGAAELIALLDHLSGGGLESAVSKGAMEIAQELRSVMATYPPKPPQSSYRRTGNLGRAWHVERRGAGAVVGNPQSYAPYVQGDKEQVWYHARTGWITDQEAVDDLRRSGIVDRIIEKYVEDELEG